MNKKLMSDVRVTVLPDQYIENVLKIMKNFMPVKDGHITYDLRVKSIREGETAIYADSITKEEGNMLTAIGYAYYMGHELSA